MYKLLYIYFFTLAIPCQGQKIAIKSNLLYDATATVNLGIELILDKNLTLDFSSNYNGWTFSNNRKWKHWLLQPEIKYWLEKSFKGSSIGLNLMGGEGNIGNVDIPLVFLGTNFKVLKDYRYDGWFIGGGVTYNYSWILSHKWNIEAGVGLGYIRFDYDKYDCPDCGSWLGKDVNNYFGFTKFAINLIYIFP